MLRQDYFLRLVEKFAQMLMQIRQRIETRQYAGAGAELDQAFRELVGLGSDKISELTEAELLARLTMDGPTHVLKEKTRMLVALLQEAGLLSAAQGRDAAGTRSCWLQALNLLLALQLQDADGELPEFVPTIDLLREQLRETPLPLPTLAALWRHYERLGACALAEDALFDLLHSQPDNRDLLVEARAFYERLLRQSDAALTGGNLPRAEVEAGLAALPAAHNLKK